MADDANNWEYGTNTQEITSTENLSSAVIGENGFFYDFARKEPFTSDDLIKIENKMSEIIDRDVITRREIWDSFHIFL